MVSQGLSVHNKGSNICILLTPYFHTHSKKMIWEPDSFMDKGIHYCKAIGWKTKIAKMYEIGQYFLLNSSVEYLKPCKMMFIYKEFIINLENVSDLMID